MNTEIKLSTPKTFSFKRTVISHGWSGLRPFTFDQQKWELTRVIDLEAKAPVTVFVTGNSRQLKIRTTQKLTRADTGKVTRDVGHIFRLDDKLEAFYDLTESHPEFSWVGKQGAGRMLRSPTVFEDLVKTICTTNCSWALTQKMVTGLVENLGRETADGRRSFPSAEAMALMPLRFFVDEVRAGYRASYLKELADRVASGELDVESWSRSDVPTAELLKQIKEVKGAGNYAAENLMKLLGRYDGLALDSWTRARFYALRNNGRKAPDKKIERYYAQFAEWRGLALWCDVTRDWLEESTQK
jgi:3-methyladenine DNA glycosylase/8-oxoguanine DNA glycosylase